MAFDWDLRCSGDAANKDAFHSEAKKRLRALAEALGFEKGSFDIRSNRGGNAVSGEITLHHDDLYIQASQPASASSERGLMIRTCKNRKDYTGGQNHFAPLSWLDEANKTKMVRLATQVLEQKRGFDADANPDRGYNPHYSTPRVSK
jgi:hypothetical protein